MNNQDNSTKQHQKGIVDPIYYEMFYLKLLGFKYWEIAEKTGYSLDRVKHIFAKGGVLNDLWEKWKIAVLENSVEEALDMMIAHLPDIMRSHITDAKSTGSLVGIAARKMIFEKTFEAKIKTIETDAAGNPLDLTKRLFIDEHGRKWQYFSDWVKFATEEEKNSNNNADTIK